MSFDRKESETMYSLKIRQSYTNNANSHQSRHIMGMGGGLDDSIKEFDMEIEDECLEFIPPEYFDSDQEEDLTLSPVGQGNLEDTILF